MSDKIERVELIVETTLSYNKSDDRIGTKTITSMLKGRNTSMNNFSDKDGLLTKEGYKVVTEILVQGLNINIQGAHQLGVIDSAKHLRDIISRLEDLFVHTGKVEHILSNRIPIDP